MQLNLNNMLKHRKILLFIGIGMSCLFDSLYLLAGFDGIPVSEHFSLSRNGISGFLSVLLYCLYVYLKTEPRPSGKAGMQMGDAMNWAGVVMVFFTLSTLLEIFLQICLYTLFDIPLDADIGVGAVRFFSAIVAFNWVFDNKNKTE